MTKVRHPLTLQEASVHKRVPFRSHVILAVFALAYAIIGQVCFMTIGEPYKAAVLELEGLNKTRSGDLLDDWDMDIVEKPKSEDAEGDEEDDERLQRPLPSEWLPSPWAMLAGFVTVFFHVLLHLLCRWLPWFKAKVQYSPAKMEEKGVHMLVTPLKYRGKAEICEVKYSDIHHRHVFEFQRQTFECFNPGEKIPDFEAKLFSNDEGTGTVQAIKRAVDIPLTDYATSTGLSISEALHRAKVYGKNEFEIPMAPFLTLYKQQLMQPIPMFQFFCAGLWMLDTYWKFTAFTLFSILMFEATTTFQRRKNLQTLRGMGNKPFPVGVYRGGEWRECLSNELLPGDVVSVKRYVEANKQLGLNADAMNVVPADIVLLSGSAVVNEATLTGESVPQIKDGIPKAKGSDAIFDMDGVHRMHVLFSGTSLISATPAKGEFHIKNPPNDGIIGYVLRTGFDSSQGELMRMIEFSKDEVVGDVKETMMALALLLFFALIAAGYLLMKGIEEGNRSTYELLLKSVLVITSVVPPTLPMQTALAVNTSLMALLKGGIFCTEPFRVPWSGKITCALFDKTGTLTTDQLLPEGIVQHDGSEGKLKAGDERDLCGLSKMSMNGKRVKILDPSGERIVVETTGDKKEKISVKPENLTYCLEPLSKADVMAQAVIGGCHAVTSVDGTLIGDPIETVALKAAHWRYDPNENTARPGDWDSMEKSANELAQEVAAMDKDAKANPQDKEKAKKRLQELRDLVQQEKDTYGKSKVVVKIVTRHHFSSKLQRMSTVCDVTGLPSSSGKQQYSFVKGSPEAIAPLLAQGSKPDWYESTYIALAERGMRVLALAYKKADGAANWARDKVESDLTFVGFLTFKCLTRADSEVVIRALKHSAHRCGMLTGDAALTALHVADEIGLTMKPALLLTDENNQSEEKGSKKAKLKWVSARQSAKKVEFPFDLNTMDKLAEDYDFVVTEKLLLEAIDQNEDFWNHVDKISVFARMSPQGKADVIRNLQDRMGHMTLMCGDGGNDVGALKQADVGIALLTGFGNANAERKKKDESTPALTDAPQSGSPNAVELTQEAKEDAAWDELNKKTQVMTQKAADSSKQGQDELKRKWAELSAKQQDWLQEELARREAAGETIGVMTQFSAMKTVISRMKNEFAKERELMQQKTGGNAFNASAKNWATSLDDIDMDMEGAGAPMVRLGDASISAPFTCRTPSVRCVIDLIRQGRCTLLSTVQQQQIMMIECMITAFTLAAISLSASRNSEIQMIATNSLLSIASIAFSYAKPIDRVSPIRPLSSLFHPAIFISLLGQAVIHLSCMTYAISMAKGIMGERAIKELIAFHRQTDKEMKDWEEPELNPEDPWAYFNSLWSMPFKPNLLNTTCYLLESAQQIAVLLVNYKGRPWMSGFTENHAMFLSLIICVTGVAVCAWEVVPYFNSLLQLEPFPSDEIRWTVMTLVGISLVGSFLWDRLIVYIFAKDIFRVMWKEMLSIRPKDLMPLVMQIGKVMGVLFVIGSGNPLIWFGAYMMYSRYKKNNPSPPPVGPQQPPCSIM